jgi:hypothetical protein
MLAAWERLLQQDLAAWANSAEAGMSLQNAQYAPRGPRSR